MNQRFPTRPEEHQLETLSERYFQASLPINWPCHKSSPDYGIDFNVELFEGSQGTGLELLVQLKASAKDTEGDNEIVRLATSTYNYLWNKLQVAMLIKYVQSDNEAYWILFRDIPTPSQDQKTFSVHIPKKNRLSEIDWQFIQNYVRSVTHTKLEAIRIRR